MTYFISIYWNLVSKSPLSISVIGNRNYLPAMMPIPTRMKIDLQTATTWLTAMARLSTPARPTPMTVCIWTKVLCLNIHYCIQLIMFTDTSLTTDSRPLSDKLDKAGMVIEGTANDAMKVDIGKPRFLIC